MKRLILFVVVVCVGGTMARGQTPFRVNINHRSVRLATLDPTEVTFFSEEFLITNLTDTLVRLDAGGRLGSGIARRWTIDEGGRRVRLFIDQSFKFSNGRAVTSRDVAASLRRQCILQRNTHFPLWKYIDGCLGLRAMTDAVTGLECESPNTLALRLTEPIRDILSKLAFFEAAVLPEEAIDPQTLRIDWRVSAGPYRVNEWRGDGITLGANRFSPHWTAAMPQTVEVQFEHNLARVRDQLDTGALHLAWQRLSPQDDMAAFAGGASRALTRAFTHLGFMALNPHAGSIRLSATRGAIRDRVMQTAIDFHESPLFARATGIFPQGLFGSADQWLPRVTLSTASLRMPLEVLVPDVYEDGKFRALEDLFSAAAVPFRLKALPFEALLHRVAQGEYEAVFIISGVSAQYPDAFFRFMMDNGALRDDGDGLQPRYQALVVAENAEEKHRALKSITDYLQEHSLLVPIWFERIPLFLNSAYEFLSFPDFSEELALWQIRRRP